MTVRNLLSWGVILLALTGTGCAVNDKIALRWDPQAHDAYRLNRGPFPREMELDVDAMLATPEVMQAKIEELKSVELDAATFPMRLRLDAAEEGRIEVVAQNARVEYAAEPKDEEERYFRDMQERSVGLVQLNTVIGEQGNNLNPYLKSQQKNTVAMLLYLPDRPVRVGERWRLPLQALTYLNTVFLADSASRDNRVWVNRVTERAGVGRVAEIVYLLREAVEGKRQAFVHDEPQPFSTEMTYFAVGEFALDEHRWLRYIGRLESTLLFVNSVDIFALLPDEGVDP